MAAPGGAGAALERPAIDNEPSLAAHDDRATIEETETSPQDPPTIKLELPESDEPIHDGANDFDKHLDACSDQNSAEHNNNAPEEPPKDDPLACVDDTFDDGGGEVCELHVYENRYNSRGVLVSLRVGAMDQLPIELCPHPQAALAVVRTYDQSRALKHTALDIRSPYIRKAMKEVIGSYPGINLSSTPIIQLGGTEIPRCVYHYRFELQAYAEASNDDDIKEHVDFMLRYLTKTMQKETSRWQMLMGPSEKNLEIEFANLWMAFRPGDLLYSLQDCMEEPRITRLRSMDLRRHELPDRSFSESWAITAELIDCNGDYVSFEQYNMGISHYDGCRAIVDLPVYPLHFHEEESKVRTDMLKRGKQWLSLVGVHHRSYHGVAQLRKTNLAPTGMSGESIFMSGYDYLPAHGGIIIDSREYNVNVAPGAVRFIAGTKCIKSSEIKEDSFTDDEILLCSPRVHGFSLATKRWGIFYVQHIKDPEFNSTAFDSLVIPQHEKELIRSLVNDHQNKHSPFDDLIKGKGKGLIFLLHGPPGVGKTLTAESLADFTRRPLYTIGCGDLGTNSNFVEGTLTRALGLASQWNALVLVDEADVFMEQRNTWNLAHSELVAVLLRALEYFEGVMFLTTNRVESIDTAFKSRIHLSLYYPRLSFEARSSIWRTFIARGSGSGAESPAWLDEKLLHRLTSYDINGRQIKNTIRMACSIAANEQRELRADDILKGLEAWTTFETDFGAMAKSEKTRVGKVAQVLKEQLHRHGWVGVILALCLSNLAARSIWSSILALMRWWRKRKRP